MTDRIRHTSLTLLGADGRPLADADVVVEQTAHAFGFGNIGFDLIDHANGTDSGEPHARGLADLWLGIFNTATLPFYWQNFEPVEGEPDTERMLGAARWFHARGVRVKGHPLVWHTLAPAWLRDRPVAEIEAATRARVRREVSGFAGLIDTWDAINEVVIMPVFTNEPAEAGASPGNSGSAAAEARGRTSNALTRLCRERGRIATVRLAFDEARAANPRATLLLNDFDLSTAYECLIEGLLEAGVGIDALGLQSHMHQGYWGEERTEEILERFARFGLPLHWTETTLLSGDLMPPEIDDLNDYQPETWPSTAEGEARQADEIERHYRTLTSHPAVEAITYWGLTDRGAWLGAPAGLVRADGTPKPAYDALRRLVKEEWWLRPTGMRTDGAGQVEVAGWAGDYRVSAGGASASVPLAGGVAEARLS